MAVKIRLRRMGKKKQPSYRVVVADSRSPRDGRIIENIGRYDPRQDPSLIEIDADRAMYWLGVGAQPTERVLKLLEVSGAMARFKASRGEVYVVPDRSLLSPTSDEPAAEVESEGDATADAPPESESAEGSAAESDAGAKDEAEAGGDVQAEAAAPVEVPDDAPDEGPDEAPVEPQTDAAEEVVEEQESS